MVVLVFFLKSFTSHLAHDFWREIIFTTHTRPLKFLSRGTRASPAPESGLVMTWHVFVFGAQMRVLAGNNFYDTCETSQISLQGYQGQPGSRFWPGDDVARFCLLVTLKKSRVYTTAPVPVYPSKHPSTAAPASSSTRHALRFRFLATTPSSNRTLDMTFSSLRSMNCTLCCSL